MREIYKTVIYSLYCDQITHVQDGRLDCDSLRMEGDMKGYEYEIVKESEENDEVTSVAFELSKAEYNAWLHVNKARCDDNLISGFDLLDDAGVDQIPLLFVEGEEQLTFWGQVFNTMG